MDELTLYYDSEGCIWYGDGDLCADVLFDNLTLGISKLDMARLFAAAPDLLAACRAAEETDRLREAAKQGLADTMDDRVWAMLMTKALMAGEHARKLRQAAIAKATQA